VIALALAACGSESGSDDDAAGGDGSSSGDSTGARPEPAVEVTITFWPEGKDGPSRQATLTCDPAGGTHPDPETACAALAANPAALEPVPPDSACTMIFGGPEEATVIGVVNGANIEAGFARSNGCELARWDSLTELLELAG
jgi:subtilisin inhibitor-like